MDIENYEKLLKQHTIECSGGVTTKLLNKHKHEVHIFPEKNYFEVGEKVHIPDINEYGYIENFNSDGTFFIKKHFSDIGRDYPRNFVKKFE